MAASRSSTHSVISAPPGRSGSSWMYTDRSSATVHTTSESFGKNAGSPRSRSYQARAAARSRTRIPAKSAMVMASQSPEYPPREVGRVDVASAQDRGDAPAGEPLRILEDGGDPQRGGRLHHEPRMLVHRAHAGLDRVLAHEDHVVEQDAQVAQHLGDRTAAGDAIGDRLDAVGLDHGSL